MSRVTLALSVLALVLLLASGPGVRLGLWDIRAGFTLLAWAAYLGLAAVAAALLQLIPGRRSGAPVAPLLVSLGLGVGAAAVPWYWRQRARAAPPIHDITTDTRDPPAFVAILPLRATAPNPAAYGGAEVARAQAAAYPDIRPLALPEPPGAAFPLALAAAHTMGWALVAADSSGGRIEATATTAWFGFRDDVVVRLRRAGMGSVIDVRSVSRVGQGDAGTNARRIRAYLARVVRGRRRGSDH